MSDLPNPINRYEKYLNAIATGNSDDLPTPITREEVFLDYIARNGGGSGSGEVTGVKGNAESNYRKGNVNITPENIGLGNVNNTSDANKPVSTAQQTALDGKVDKVTGKGLSTNDYDNTAKGIVDGVTSALAGKANSSDLGDKSNLTTTDKSSCVAAINEVNGKLAKSQTLVNLDSAYDAGTDWNIVKQGNICIMNMRNLKDIPAGETIIGTIPVGFRPEETFYEFVYIVFKDIHLGFHIANNGNITINNTTGAAISGEIYVNRHVTYFAA